MSVSERSCGCWFDLSLSRTQVRFLLPMHRWLCHVCLIRRCWCRERCCSSNLEVGEDDTVLLSCPGANFLVGELSSVCRECPVMTRLLWWRGEVVVEICAFTYTGYRLLPPTSSSLVWRAQPIISVVWVRGWHAFFPRWGWSTNNQVNERKSPWAEKGLFIFLFHFLLLPILLRFLSLRKLLSGGWSYTPRCMFHNRLTASLCNSARSHHASKWYQAVLFYPVILNCFTFGFCLLN